MNAFTAIGLCFILSILFTTTVYLADRWYTRLDEYSSHLAIMQYAVLFFIFFVVSLMITLLILI